MKTTFAAAAVLAVSFSGALFGDHRPDRERRYPSPYEMERVAVLAHQVEDIAYSIRAQAARNNRRPDRPEAEMLDALYQLEYTANHFHGQVESSYQEPQHTEEDFEELLDAFFTTADALTYVARRPYVDRGMDEIAVLLGQLTRHYGRQDRCGEWRHGYDHRRFEGRGSNRYDRYQRYDRHEGRDRDRLDRDDWRQRWR